MFLLKGNYWTATLYFKARNGTYKRVPQRAQQGIEKTNGGMVPNSPSPSCPLSMLTNVSQMVYYMTDALFSTTQSSPVTAFKPGFRMLVGSVSNKDREGARDFRQLTYICMKDEGTREPETLEFPKECVSHPNTIHTLGPELKGRVGANTCVPGRVRWAS